MWAAQPQRSATDLPPLTQPVSGDEHWQSVGGEGGGGGGANPGGKDGNGGGEGGPGGGEQVLHVTGQLVSWP